MERQSDRRIAEVYDLSKGASVYEYMQCALWTLTVRFPSDPSPSGKIAGSNSTIEIARWSPGKFNWIWQIKAHKFLYFRWQWKLSSSQLRWLRWAKVLLHSSYEGDVSLWCSTHQAGASGWCSPAKTIVMYRHNLTMLSWKMSNNVNNCLMNNFM